MIFGLPLTSSTDAVDSSLVLEFIEEAHNGQKKRREQLGARLQGFGT